MLALDCLRVLLAHLMLLGSEMPRIGPPPIRVKPCDAKRRQQLLELQEDGVLPSSEYIRQDLPRISHSAPVLRKNAAAIMQVVWRDHSHGANGPIESRSAKMIRYDLSLIPEAFKFVWAHVNVAENTPQSSNFERTVAMHRNGRTRGISSHDMMAPAYPNHRKALRLQEAHHLVAAWAR
jgi:hypothetical protein